MNYESMTSSGQLEAVMGAHVIMIMSRCQSTALSTDARFFTSNNRLCLWLQEFLARSSSYSLQAIQRYQQLNFVHAIPVPRLNAYLSLLIGILELHHELAVCSMKYALS